ncbi:MAG TPA: TonB family protein [Bacteroidia bacterium]|nr:TonB family protein [Bacteroidia bacterium]
MKGHKTSGDWSDVTSYGRNEIVFEGRHKEYGAYAMRQRYSHVLLLGLLVSVSTGILCAGIPFVINLIDKHKEIVIPGGGVDAHPTTYTVTLEPKTKTQPQPRPKTKEPKNNQTQNTIPVVIQKPKTTDSVPTNKQQNLTDPGTINQHTGTTGTSVQIKPTDGTGTTVVPTEIYHVVQVMPKFNGDLPSFIGHNLTYPELERTSQIEGTAYISFIVEPDGSVSTVKVVHGIAGGPALDAEAARVVSAMPAWTPGSQNGHPVRVQYTIPIKFQLK